MARKTWFGTQDVTRATQFLKYLRSKKEQKLLIKMLIFKYLVEERRLVIAKQRIAEDEKFVFTFLQLFVLIFFSFTDFLSSQVLKFQNITLY